MKKILKITSLLLALTLALSAFVSCGKKKGPTDNDNAPADTAVSGDTAEQSSESITVKTPEEVHPYAWLGLEAMPKCNYLDLVASNHYVMVSDFYALSVVTEQTEAVDGINTYTGNGASRTYSIDGVTYSINESSKMYMEYDMSSSAEISRASIENSMANGINTSGRVYSTTGKGSIPLYSDRTGDTAEYEYYEYITDSSADTVINKLTERFYLKDGDVFAVYQMSEVSTLSTESLKVIKSISSDIPEDMLTVPDLTDYKKYN